MNGMEVRKTWKKWLKPRQIFWLSNFRLQVNKIYYITIHKYLHMGSAYHLNKLFRFILSNHPRYTLWKWKFSFLFTLEDGKSGHSLIHDRAMKGNGFETGLKSQILQYFVSLHSKNYQLNQFLLCIPAMVTVPPEIQINGLAHTNC